MPNRTAWIICLSAAFFPFYSFFQMALFNVSGPFIQENTHLTIVQLGVLSAAYLYAQSLFLIPAGILLDRFSPSKLITIAMLLLASGTLGLVLFSSFYMLLFARIITGVSHAFAILGCFHLIAQWFPKDKNAFIMGLVVTLALLGGLIAQTPFLILINRVGWENAMLINVIIGYFITFIFYLALRDSPQFIFIKKIPLSRTVNELIIIAKNSQNWLCGIYAGGLSLPLLVLGTTWGVSYLSHVHNFSSLQSLTITSMIFIGMMLGSPSAGIIADILRNKKTILVFSSLALVVTFSIMLFNDLSFQSFILLFFLIGFLSGAEILAYPIVVQNNDNHLTGTALGFSSTIIMLSGAIAQTLVGWLAVKLGDASTEQYRFDVAIYILLTISTLCFVIAFLIKERKN